MHHPSYHVGILLGVTPSEPSGDHCAYLLCVILQTLKGPLLAVRLEGDLNRSDGSTRKGSLGRVLGSHDN